MRRVVTFIMSDTVGVPFSSSLGVIQVSLIPQINDLPLATTLAAGRRLLISPGKDPYPGLSEPIAPFKENPKCLLISPLDPVQHARLLVPVAPKHTCSILIFC
jgi:hypothetical protein